MKTAVIFFFAVLSEVTATSALKFSEGITRLVPSVIVVLGYGLSFYLLSLSLKVIPIGAAYALWSGIGIVLIISGILTINLFSKVTAFFSRRFSFWPCRDSAMAKDCDPAFGLYTGV